MEPVAHFGIRKGEADFRVTIKWTNGETQSFSIDKLNQELIVKQKLYSSKLNCNFYLQSILLILYMIYDYQNLKKLHLN